MHLGEIKELPHPIPSKRWRRIVHIPTTLKRLFLAEEINDLYWTSELEDKMYKALKKVNIFPERQYLVRINRQFYFLDFCIFCRKANIDLECDGERYHTLPEALSRDRERNNELTSFGWSVLRFSGKDIRKDIKKCLKTIDRTAKTLNSLV
ncbi:MAG: endonuclease domain-containing protein [bacterium]